MLNSTKTVSSKQAKFMAVVAVCLAAALTLFLSGCSSNDTKKSDEADETTTEQVEQENQNAANNAAEQAAENANATDVAAEDTTVGSTLTDEAAFQIALDDAGLTAKDVASVESQTRADYQGVEVYEVQFTAKDSEYEYAIDVTTGEIVEKSIDNEPVAINAGQNAKAQAISMDEAKAIAAEDAGFTAKDVKFTEQKLDTENGIEAYEITYVKDGNQYEYTINAQTGVIMEQEVEAAK